MSDSTESLGRRPERPAASTRVAFFALALAAVVLVAALALTGFERKAESFRPLGAEIALDGNGFRVEAVHQSSTGLRDGDLIVLVGGESPIDRVAFEAELRARDRTELLLMRDGALLEQTYERPALHIEWPFLVLALIGVFYLLIGLYTSLKDQRLQARLFFTWCLTAAALYLISPRLPPVDGVDITLYWVDLVARLLLPALTLHLFLVFPTRLVSAPWSRALPLLYLPPAAFAAFHADQIAADGGWLLGRLASAKLLLAVERLELVFLVACSLTAAFLLALRLARRPSWEHRRQVQAMIIGLVGGYVPFLILYLLPWNLGFVTPTWTTLTAVVPLVLVPLGFAWAILKYKLLDLGPILRDAVAYSAAGLVGVFGFQLAQVLIQQGVAEELSLARNVLTFGAGLALAGVLVPTKNAVSQGLEQLRLGERLSQRRMLRQLGRQLLLERDLGTLCLTLVDELEDTLLVTVDLYLPTDDEGDLVFRSLKPRAGAPLTLDGRELGIERSEPSRRDGPAEIDPLFGEDFWQLDLTAISSFALPGDAPSKTERLYRAGYRYAFPVRVRRAPTAIAVIGYKLGEEPLSSEDVDLLRSVLDQAALAIENARLFDELQRRLAEVTDLEAYSQGIFESSPAGIAVLDETDRIDTANESFGQICGHEPHTLVGRALAEVLPVEPLPATGASPVDIGWCDADGEERHLQVSVARWRGADGDPPARVLVVLDVSERVSLEHDVQEKERLASLGMLAAGVAHEVNTPLTGISSYAQFLMQDTDEDDPRYELLRKMERQTQRASQIVNNLLDFARNRRDEMSRVHLTPIVVDALTLLEERASRSGVALSWRTSDDPHPVRGHESELHQVVTNLVVNAIDATSGRESREVRVELDASAGRVRLRVRDTGPGIPPERIETIFKPFFSSKLGHGGSGLGLAITHNIVHRHGGEITVANHGDGDGDGDGDRDGCTFTVELASYPAEAASPRAI